MVIRRGKKHGHNSPPPPCLIGLKDIKYLNYLYNFFLKCVRNYSDAMDLIEAFVIVLLIIYLIIFVLILISDGDLSLMFWDRFGKKLGKYVRLFLG